MSAVTDKGLSARTQSAALAALEGRRSGLRAALPFAGPAFVASIAYVDPGNFATNIEAGARYNYGLLWVVLLANIIAMLFQAQSAKLGVVTGESLASLCRQRFPKPVVLAMWVISEIAAMATDLAEFLGAAIGLALLTGLPIFVSLIAVGAFTLAFLMIQRRGFRPLELAIGAFVGAIGLSYLFELIIAPPAWGQAAHGLFIPSLPDARAVTLAVGIVGATVMPHAIYLHSTLTRGRIPARDEATKRRIVRASNRETLVALGLAGLVNLAMVAMAASAFHAGHSDVAEIETAYRTLIPLLGSAAAGLFLTALLASGLSSSVVGTIAGQSIMQDFVGFPIPIWVRRLVTMAPAFVVVAWGANPTDTLVWSQVVLSLALPVPIVALVLIGSDPRVMGSFALSTPVRAASWAAAAVIILLNVALLYLAFRGDAGG